MKSAPTEASAGANAEVSHARRKTVSSWSGYGALTGRATKGEGSSGCAEPLRTSQFCNARFAADGRSA